MTAESEKAIPRKTILTFSIMACMAVGSIALLVDEKNIAIGAFLALSASSYLLGTGDDDAS